MESVDDLILFAAVVDQGGFSGAARALGIPKSRVSRRIGDLEQRLGIRLLQRSTRKVQVTDVGMEFYRRCQVVIEATRAAMDVAEQARMTPSGRLKVSCPPSIAYRFLVPYLPKFLLAHPEVRLEFDFTNRHVDVISDGYDIALRSQPTLEDSELVVYTFAMSRQVLVASPNYIARHGPFDTVSALQSGVGLGTASQIGRRPSWHFYDPNGFPVKVDYVAALLADDLHLLFQSALAGVGIAQLPFNMCASAIKEGRLEILLPDHVLPSNQLHAVYPSRRGVAPAVRAFLAMLTEQIPAVMDRMSQGKPLRDD